MFKTDENLPVEVADLFRVRGHDAMTVLEQQLGGEADPRIANVCLAEQRTLVTLDLDFADIRTYPPRDYHGIIVLRPRRQRIDIILSILGRALPSLESEDSIARKLFILDDAHIRVHD